GLALKIQGGFFENKKYAYELIVSSGLIENIRLEGNNYLLMNKTLQKIDNTKPRTGFYLQVIGNNIPENFSTDKETT
ncbi:hypothetical protein, partial [Mesobacillus zeae]